MANCLAQRNEADAVAFVAEPVFMGRAATDTFADGALPKAGESEDILDADAVVQAAPERVEDDEVDAVVPIPPYPVKYVFRYIGNVHEANNALRHIVRGAVGFDTEHTDPKGDDSIDVDATLDDARPLQHPESHSGDGINWAASKLCIVQVAEGGRVYIVDVKRMRAFPEQLRRIVTSTTIAKVGCGIVNDGRVVGDCTGVCGNAFVDVGLMVKFANAERYAEEDGTGLGLERCVREVFGTYLDKTVTAKLKWDENITPEHMLYAGLDAQASLEVFQDAVWQIIGKELQIARVISKDWYTFNWEAGSKAEDAGKAVQPLSVV
ncbi:ribonuclease H-like domain-containing protein [Mycena crocata]|nr:ribonuclease H-like domain-containing protein [Mycena crocata]